MATNANAAQLASEARRLYTDELVKGLPNLVRHVVDGARHSLDKPAEYQTAQRRRELMQGLQKSARHWLAGMNELFKGLGRVAETVDPKKYYAATRYVG